MKNVFKNTLKGLETILLRENKLCGYVNLAHSIPTQMTRFPNKTPYFVAIVITTTEARIKK